MRATPAPSSGPHGQLDIEGLVVRYEQTVAVSDVRLTVAPGEWLGVIGANGAGKSSLLRAVARLSAYEGAVRIGGRDTAGLSRRRFAQLVAYVPQKPELPAQMRAVDYVALGRLPHLGYFGAENPRDRLRCGELLARLSLAHMSDRPLGAMSGGELQRLVLARALAQEAPILLMDEPTSALDLGRRVEALELVDELRRERQLTVVSALHDLTLAAQFADRLVLLAGGVIVATGTPHEVLVEGALDQHFGTRVQVLQGEDGEVIVVPRRQRERTS